MEPAPLILSPESYEQERERGRLVIFGDGRTGTRTPSRRSMDRGDECLSQQRCRHSPTAHGHAATLSTRLMPHRCISGVSGFDSPQTRWHEPRGVDRRRHRPPCRPPDANRDGAHGGIALGLSASGRRTYIQQRRQLGIDQIGGATIHKHLRYHLAPCDEIGEAYPRHPDQGSEELIENLGTHPSGEHHLRGVEQSAHSSVAVPEVTRAAWAPRITSRVAPRPSLSPPLPSGCKISAGEPGRRL